MRNLLVRVLSVRIVVAVVAVPGVLQALEERSRHTGRKRRHKQIRVSE